VSIDSRVVLLFNTSAFAGLEKPLVFVKSF